MKYEIYTTDGKVQHYSKDEDINQKLSHIIGKKFVDYRKKWDQTNNFELITNFPLFLQVEINQKCNYRCPHCIIGNPDERIKMYDESQNLSFMQFKKIVDEGSEFGCPSISVQGENEPFLIKDYEKYISYANQKGFIDIMTNTNGSAITKTTAQKILDSGLTRLRFSLDAFTDKTYKTVRVGAIDLDKVKKNIFTFLDLKEKGGYELPIVGVSFCKLRGNIHELEDFKNYWKDKVDIVTIQTYVPPTLNKKEHFDHYTEDQFYKEPNLTFKCNQPFNRLQIRNNEIFPCCYSLVMSDKGSKSYKDFVIGDLNKDTLYEAWNGKKMRALREIHANGNLVKNSTCLNCAKFTFPTKSLIKEKKSSFSNS
jgi:MoaA/NifB/PqqE/SkfB family radical SAM enzyme